MGFLKAGGFRGIYNGLGAAALGSAPGAALFFSTYETMKAKLRQNENITNDAVTHMMAASMGEIAACLVRVPTEVVKSRMQIYSGTHPQHAAPSLLETISTVTQERHGSSWLVNYTGGLYRGYGMTLFREIPFAMIQFPLYEQFKVSWRDWQNSSNNNNNSKDLYPWQAAACGSLSGAIAGALTTPLDVLKTRTQARSILQSY
jgi:solute carrier family 25 (mitochondrial S-adenosylmethionine transporter), member 26